MARRLLPLLLLACGTCVPPDKALPLGGALFELRASVLTKQGVPGYVFVDGWALHVERALLSFKTVTIGRVDDESACAYRGRAEQRNVVFDALVGIDQSFNGLLPDSCTDVGAVFGPPDFETIPTAGATADDLFALARDPGAHTMVVAIATRGEEPPVGDRYRVELRFETARTSSKLAGCRASTRGVKIEANRRDEVRIAFAVEAFFREAPSTSGSLRFAPFADADRDSDHVITMAELDALPLAAARAYSDSYSLPSAASFGDFVRDQFKRAFSFRQDGTCTGKDVNSD